jgi:hypothetical protein
MQQFEDIYMILEIESSNDGLGFIDTFASERIVLQNVDAHWVDVLQELLDVQAETLTLEHLVLDVEKLFAIARDNGHLDPRMIHALKCVDILLQAGYIQPLLEVLMVRHFQLESVSGDSPRVALTIRDGAEVCCLETTWHYAWMLPWTISRASQQITSFHADLSRHIGAVLPEGCINRDRLLYGELEMYTAIWNLTESDVECILAGRSEQLVQDCFTLGRPWNFFTLE